jgi:hypothetical protein
MYQGCQIHIVFRIYLTRTDCPASVFPVVVWVSLDVRRFFNSSPLIA